MVADLELLALNDPMRMLKAKPEMERTSRGLRINIFR